jgi:glutaredoxin
VTVYSRPGCHLCDDALAQVEAIARDHPGTEVAVVDIERDDGMLVRYLERIPVVEVDGREVSDLVFDPTRLIEALGTT